MKGMLSPSENSTVRAGRPCGSLYTQVHDSLSAVASTPAASGGILSCQLGCQQAERSGAAAAAAAAGGALKSACSSSRRSARVCQKQQQQQQQRRQNGQNTATHRSWSSSAALWWPGRPPVWSAPRTAGSGCAAPHLNGGRRSWRGWSAAFAVGGAHSGRASERVWASVAPPTAAPAGSPANLARE